MHSENLENLMLIPFSPPQTLGRAEILLHRLLNQKARLYSVDVTFLYKPHYEIK